MASEDPNQKPAEAEGGNRQTQPRGEKHRDWLDYVKFAAELIGLGVLIAYTTFAALQWCEMKKAADATKIAADAAQSTAELNKQIMRSTNAATITPTVGPPTINDLGSFGYGITVTFSNNGKLIAKNFTAEGTLIRQTVPDYGTVGRERKFAIAQDQVRTVQGVSGHFDASFVTEQDVQRIRDLRETIEIKGSYRYENGIGETVADSFCVLYFRVRGPTGSWNEGWFPCADGKLMVSDILRYRKHEPQTK